MIGIVAGDVGAIGIETVEETAEEIGTGTEIVVVREIATEAVNVSATAIADADRASERKSAPSAVAARGPIAPREKSRVEGAKSLHARADVTRRAGSARASGKRRPDALLAMNAIGARKRREPPGEGSPAVANASPSRRRSTMTPNTMASVPRRSRKSVPARVARRVETAKVAARRAGAGPSGKSGLVVVEAEVATARIGMSTPRTNPTARSATPGVEADGNAPVGGGRSAIVPTLIGAILAAVILAAAIPATMKTARVEAVAETAVETETTEIRTTARVAIRLAGVAADEASDRTRLIATTVATVVGDAHATARSGKNGAPAASESPPAPARSPRSKNTTTTKTTASTRT